MSVLAVAASPPFNMARGASCVARRMLGVLALAVIPTARSARCEVGWYAPNTTAPCAACPAGFSRPAEGTEAFCIPCFPGSFAATRGSATCQQCPRGQFQSAQKATECAVVPPGHERAAPTAVIACPVGKHGSGSGDMCRDCPRGWFQNEKEATSCKKCGAARYSNSTGRTSTCQICPAGYYTGDMTKGIVLYAQTGCTPCPLGSYSSKEGAAKSWPCFACMTTNVGPKFVPNRHGFDSENPTVGDLIGSYSDELGMERCKFCPAGFYQNQNRSRSCLSCPRGWFQGDVGRTMCKKCEVGRFGPTENSKSSNDCQSCVSGKTTNVGTVSIQLSDCKCMATCTTPMDCTYQNGSQCISCPKGANCTSVVNGITLQHINTLPGWWRPSRDTSVFLPCETPGADGTVLIDESRCCPHLQCINLTWGDPDEQCGSGYRGPLCGACAAMHVRIGNECKPCPTEATLAQTFGALFVTIFLLSLFMCLMIVRCATRGSKREKAVNPKAILGQVKILIMFAQLVSSMPHVLEEVPWPQNFKLFLIAIGAPFNLDFLSLFSISNCRLSVLPLDAFLLHMSIPPLLVLGIAFAFFATKLMCTASEFELEARKNLSTKSAIFVVQLRKFP